MAKKSEGAGGTVQATRPEGRPVLLTTLHKGVFMGWATDTSGTTVRLLRARNCVYWSSDVRGFVGLATTGPTPSCRIGPAANIEVRDVTSVVEVEPEAVERWERAPWN